MRIQLLSDLHLETEHFVPEPAPGAELLVLAGDIDSGWGGLAPFRHWPVPVLMVAGNHEFDRRDLATAWPALRSRCAELGMTLLECESRVLADASGRRIRFVGTTRWCDFDVFGPAGRDKAMRAAGHYLRVMGSTRGGAPLDAPAVRDEALRCRAWLESELQGKAALRPRDSADWDATVVITHFAPSLKSADPRYGHQPGTASFCNADDDLLPHADLWIHGHLHCRHDYRVAHAHGSTRVVSNARGHTRRGEVERYPAACVIEV
ncbi:MAG: phosphoesterase [Methylibium sp. NZG]|nr:MAG: phosphoesterase [Methylibium sp. NZG]